MKYKIIFSDFDGTLTDASGMVRDSFFELLSLLQEHEAKLVIVSGRSLSWGHFLLTHFPIECAIMEGGGVILTKSSDGLFLEECLVSESDLSVLEEATSDLVDAIGPKFLSSDSFGRKTDRALEIYHMDEKSKKKAYQILHDFKVNHSTSNVHLNYWCGDISKYKATMRYLKKHSPKTDVSECVYFGDALNDQSMFEHFPESVGVSNIKKYLAEMDHKPKVILEGPQNAHADGVLKNRFFVI